MKLMDNRKNNTKGLTYADLPIGTCFEDSAGFICIKTNSCGGCIFYTSENYWDSAKQELDERVTVLNSTITIS